MKSPMLYCLLAAIGLPGCTRAGQPPIAPVAHLDVPRYMGRWYVIATIPTRPERNSHNAVELYQLTPDGEICTRYVHRQDGFEGPIDTIGSVATVDADPSQARWHVHFAWFFKTQYLVAWLAPDYGQVIVARDKRDYLWYMARTPQVPAADYQAMLTRVAALGYDPAQVVKVPQRWPDTGVAQAIDGAIADCR